MKYFDRNSDDARMDKDVRPLLQGLLENTQVFGPDDDDAPQVTDALKYTQDTQKRRDVDEYDGSDPFIESIIDIFRFQPLDFQVNSWNVMRRLDSKRRESDKSQRVIFSAPTGFGKTESFLGPLYQLLREGQQEMTILVYPSRALLQDQLSRILEHIHTIRETSGDELSVGIWTGQTPYEISDVESDFFERSGSAQEFKLANCWCGSDEEANSFIYRGGREGYSIVCENDDEHSFSNRELILNRTDMRKGGHPNILLTTLESLELFGLKPNYDIINHADSIVFDEIHLYTGLRGAHTANIVDNIESVTDDPMLWVGSSATIDDKEKFAGKIFPPEGDLEAVSPGDSDFDTENDDKEHYYFMKSTESGPGVSSMYIQQILLLGHALLEKQNGSRGKILSFIDSISQVNQKRTQLEDADGNRHLWRHHIGTRDTDDWEVVAEEMDYEFLSEDLDFGSVYSDVGFDASVKDNDVLLSTNFLEVGIDVGDITIVTQYRTPWNLSSFVQRAGRAAREEGTDSHIFVFLSDLTQDANMFYRADRFLSSEIRTPLKTDNEVVEWIHDTFESYYEVATDIRNRRDFSNQKEDLHEEFLVDELGWEDYHTLITDPKQILGRELDIYESFDSLTGQKPVEEVLAKLEGEEEELTDQLSIEGVEGDTVSSLEQSIHENILRFVQERTEVTEQCRELDDDVDVPSEDLLDDLSSVREDLVDQAEGELASGTTTTPDSYRDVLPDLFDITSDVLRLRNEVKREPDLDIEIGEFEFSAQDISDQISELETIADDDEIRRVEKKRKKIQYLMKALEEIHEYNSIPSNHMSLYYVKQLLRGGYYFNRFLQVGGGSLGSGDVWYIPENYFNDAGKYFTVFYGDDGGDSEEPIDKLVHSYTPFRSEYQQDAGHLQAFVPPTVVEDDETVRFDFSGIDVGESHEDIIVPDSIRLADVEDLSGSKALNIVRYCPQCLQILDEGSCLRHNDSKLGKIHAIPDLETTLTERVEEKSRGNAILADVSGKVRLTGASLEITPAGYNSKKGEYIFVGGDRIKREITAPEQTIGFTIDTRGLIFEISDFLNVVDDEDTMEYARRYNDFDNASPQYVATHTAAHFYTQLVADLAGISPNMLFYGVDAEEEEVYVFERSQGGQGIVDLVFDDIREDPATALEAVTRITYNPQVINERLWADRDFVELLQEGSENDQTEGLIREFDCVPIYDHIVDLIVEEVQSSIDRANQLAQEESISLETAYEVKHVVARERVAGNSSFPEDEVSTVVPDVDEYERIKTLFFSPDIDGCVENLHLSECISPHDQSDALSYVFLESLREELIEYVPKDKTADHIFDKEMFPGGEYDGTNVFITL
jgi:CRISPR/Cas system-associated endonuclease/helicase Cas3